MSTAVSTSRAGGRPSKEKHAKATAQPQAKTDTSSTKMHQATPEQLRLAQISQISEDETIFRQKVQQIIDLTGKAQDECEIALHDCQLDTESAINMLLEGENQQGEWRETGGKKKKRSNPPTKTEPPQNNVEEKPEKSEPTFERDRPERGDNRPESSSRRGRRFDTRPPRLARGRGRERGDGFRGNRDNNEFEGKENGFGTFDKDRDTDSRGRGRGRGRGGGPRRGGRGSFNRNPRFDKGPQIDTWTNETAANAEKENTSSPWDSVEDWNEDTWTGSLSETKVFTATTVQEDPTPENTTPMGDATNTLGQRLDLGALLQKPTSDSPEPAYITQYNQQATESIKNSIGIGSSPRQNITNQLAGSALTNHMQSGSLSSQMPPSSLSNQLSVSQQSPSNAINALVSSFGQTPYSQSSSGFNPSVSAYSHSPPGFNQTTGFSQTQSTSGFSQSQSTSGFTQSQATSGFSQSPSSVYPSQSSAYNQSQSSGFSQNAASVYSSSLEQNTGGQVDSASSPQSGLQQRPKSHRTKLPPPSKIPASAVEMPGHMMTTLDVQFGTWEFGSDNSSPFSFGGEPVGTSSGASSTSPTISSHLPAQQQVNSKPSEPVISSIMTTPPTNSTTAMSGGESPRANIFHNSPYTTPTKKDSASRPQNKMSPPEPIPFPPSQSDRKSSPMMGSQRPGSSNSLTSGPLATSKPDSSNLNSYSQSSQGYASTTYPSQKTGLSTNSGRSSGAGLSSNTGLTNTPGLSNSAAISNNTGLSNSAGLSSTSGFSHSSSTQPGSYQYPSGSSQYPSSQNQYPGGQSQYPSGGQSQYPSAPYHSSQYQSYGQSSSSFQNQSSYSSGSGSYNSGNTNQANPSNLYQSSATNSYQSHANQNSLYHQGNSSQTTSYQPQTNSSSYHSSRDSQAGSYPTSVSRDSQSASYSGNVSQSGSYPASVTQTGTYPASVTQTGTYPASVTQSGTYPASVTQSGTYPASASQSGTYPASASQSGTYPASASQSGTYPASASQSGSYQTNVTQSGSFPVSGSRDSQTGSSFQTTVTQSNTTSYQRDGQSGLSTPATQNQSVYTTSQGYGSTPHQNSLPSNLQTPPLSGVAANKISETLSKMNVKDTSIDTRQSPSQYDSSTSTTTSSLTTTTITTSLATGTSTPSAIVSTIALTTTVGSTKIMTAPSTSSTKNAPSLPPGVVLGHQYIGVQGTMPPYFGLQQHLYASYADELQLQLQQRLPPLANYNYDMSGFGAPSTMTGRDQTPLGNVPYSAADNKIGRVDAQSPIPASQQQSTQSAHQQQHFINVPYGYYYPSVLPSGYQYPATMFQVPPVTNTAHAGTTANTQYQKTYGGSHAYPSNKGGYEDLTQGTDFVKSAYGNPAQNKVAGISGPVASVAADMPGTGYGKSHTQAFDKQGFHAGTPPPFNLPLATGTQTGPLGAPANPYGGAPFMNVPMMPHQAHSLLHPNMQQDSTSGSSRGSHVHSQQNSTQAKAGGGKTYGTTNWNY